jgi:hypothetical protein
MACWRLKEVISLRYNLMINEQIVEKVLEKYDIETVNKVINDTLRNFVDRQDPDLFREKFGDEMYEKYYEHKDKVEFFRKRKERLAKQDAEAARKAALKEEAQKGARDGV